MQNPSIFTHANLHISEKQLSRGEERPDSDVDLLVKLDYSQPIGLKYFSMMTDLEQKLGRKVDLVSEDGLQPLSPRPRQLFGIFF